jgi:phosphohistidine swiveling domain-containing protein
MLRALGATGPEVGGKARGLALALAAGLPVPPGFVVTATDPVPDALPPGTYVVRSSATVEDGPGHAAAGVFRSLRDVDARDVPDAVRAVRASLHEPTARAYLGRIGVTDAAMAVVIQEQIPGTPVTATARSGQVLVEVGEALAQVEPDGTVTGGGIDGALVAAVATLARRAEAALGAPADVELVAGARLWLVQLRPIPTPPATAPVVSAAELEAALAFSRAEPDALWSWDASHNPAPLSPAQADLVALVDAADAATVRQRVVLGYLYTTPHRAPPPLRRLAPAEIARVFSDELAPAFERALARMGDDLDETLEAYVALYRLYARVLAPNLPSAPIAVAPPDAGAELAAAWDVAAPTLSVRSLPVRSLREADDVYFARAQAGVRRALAARARRFGLEADDLAFLPLADLRRATPPPDAAARAAAARVELLRLARFAPPLAIQNGRAIFRPPAAGLRGRGTGGRVRGRVRIIDPAAPRAADGEVAVVATVIPPMAPLLVGAAAIVAEHGGLLGHGAALARELGIPCIVGCVGVLTTLRDGDEVWIDADAGVVIPLGHAALG